MIELEIKGLYVIKNLVTSEIKFFASLLEARNYVVKHRDFKLKGRL